MKQIRIILDKDKARKLNDILGPVYTGYPYLVTQIVPTLIHIIPLPDKGKVWLVAAAVAQAHANNLPTCLVFSDNACLYVDVPHGTQESDFPPLGSVIHGKLKPAVEFDENSELVQRKRALVIYENGQNKSGHLLGDLRKGGRRATPKEIKKLTGQDANALPKGLSVCSACKKTKGWCLDPSDEAGDWLVPVHCACDNKNLCARCGQKLHETKLNGNSYEPADGQIWHTPGFCGLSHQCSKRGRVLC